MNKHLPSRVISLLLLSASLLSPNINLGLGNGQKRSSVTQRPRSGAAAIVAEADSLADASKWSEAIAAYKRAIELDANYAPAYGGLGDAYLYSGKWEQALQAYQDEVRLAAKDAQAYYDLGYAYNTMGRHGEAFAPLVKAITLDPNFAEAHYGIGYAYLRGSDFEKSVSFFKSAIRLAADYADAYYGLGQAYARLGKAEAANEQLKRLASINQELARKLEREISRALAASANDVTSSSQPTVQKQAGQVGATQTPTESSPPTPSNTIQPATRPRRAASTETGTPVAPLPKVEPELIYGKAIYSETKFDFDTLDGASVNSRDGTLVLFGHSAGPSMRSIPYFDYLATSFESNDPTFSLEFTPESSRAIDRAYEIASHELVNRLTGTIDSSGRVTKRGEWWYRMLGADVREGMNKMSLWMAVFRAAGYPHAGEVMKVIDEFEHAAAARTANQKVMDPDGSERSPFEHLINATTPLAVSIDQNFIQTYANAMNGDESAKRTLLSWVLRGIGRAYKLGDNRYTDQYESFMRGGDDYAMAMEKALNNSQDDTVQVQKNAFDALVGDRTMIHVPPDVMREVLGVTPIAVPIYSGLASHSLLAKLAFDVDVFGKNLMDMPEIKSEVPGYRTYFEWLQTVNRAPATEGHTWFAPARFELFESADGASVRFGKTPIRIHMERYEIGTTSSERKSVADPLLKEYADELTALYDPLAVKFPVLSDLREGMKVLAIAAWLKQKGIKLALPTEGRGSWNPPAQTEGVVHMEIAVKEARVGQLMSASGGIDLRVERNWNLVKDAINSQPGPPPAHRVALKFDPASGAVNTAVARFVDSAEPATAPRVDINKPVDPASLITAEDCEFAARRMAQLETLEKKLVAKQAQVAQWTKEMIAYKRDFDQLHAEAVHGEIAEMIDVIPAEFIFNQLLKKGMITLETGKRLKRSFNQLTDAAKAVANTSEIRNQPDLVKVEITATQDTITQLIEVGSQLPENDPARVWEERTVKGLQMFGAVAKAMLADVPNDAKWWERAAPVADLILDFIAISNPEFTPLIAGLRVIDREGQNIVLSRARNGLGGAVSDNWNAGIYLSQKLLRVRSDIGETHRTITLCLNRTSLN